MTKGLHIPEELLDKIEYILNHLAEKPAQIVSC